MLFKILKIPKIRTAKVNNQAESILKVIKLVKIS
jgi:hypothetical protein